MDQRGWDLLWFGASTLLGWFARELRYRQRARRLAKTLRRRKGDKEHGRTRGA